MNRSRYNIRRRIINKSQKKDGVQNQNQKEKVNN